MSNDRAKIALQAGGRYVAAVEACSGDDKMQGSAESERKEHVG